MHAATITVHAPVCPKRWPASTHRLVAAADERVAAAAPAIGVQNWGWALQNDSWQARLASVPLLGPAAAADLGKAAPDAAVAEAVVRKLLPGAWCQNVFCERVPLPCSPLPYPPPAATSSFLQLYFQHNTAATPHSPVYKLAHFRRPAGWL